VRITSRPDREDVWGGLTLWKGALYVTLASASCDLPPFRGRIVAIDAATASITKVFWVTGKHGPSGGGIWGWGGVSVDPANANVYAATGNALADPESYGYAEHVVRLGPGLGVKASNYPGLNAVAGDFGMTPT